MHQFIELKVTVQDNKGVRRQIKRMVNVNEVLSVSQTNEGKCIVFIKEHLQTPRPKHSKKTEPDYPKYSQAVVLPTHVDNDYNDLRKELTGQSILEPDSKIAQLHN